VAQESPAGGWVQEVSRPSRWQRLWEPFWAVPLAMAVAAVGLGLALPMFDEVVWPWLPMVFHGGPDGARSVLSTITSAMISVTGLVFSITMVVLQLASSQFTPTGGRFGYSACADSPAGASSRRHLARRGVRVRAVAGGPSAGRRGGGRRRGGVDPVLWTS